MPRWECGQERRRHDGQAEETYRIRTEVSLVSYLLPLYRYYEERLSL
jgi:hypothetical protein